MSEPNSYFPSYTFTVSVPPSANITETIVDNFNTGWAEIDSRIACIELSASKLWGPMKDIYQRYGNRWKAAMALTQQFSATWENVSSLVEANSARWLEPLTIVYPFSIPLENLTIKIQTFTDWLNKTFPVFPENQEKPDYVENQRAIVYTLQWYQKLLLDTVANLERNRVCTFVAGHSIQNITCLRQVAAIGGRIGRRRLITVPVKWFRCFYRASCNATAEGSSSLAQHFGVRFADVIESREVNALYFIVKDCSWQFDYFV